MEEDEEKPKKQRRTAARMYALLVEEHGFTGAKSTVRAYVGELRKRVRKQVYVPLSYRPGETMQVDFGEGEVIIGGERVQIVYFVAWMAYSGFAATTCTKLTSVTRPRAGRKAGGEQRGLRAAQLAGGRA